jgi:hypothetical protein
MFTPEGYWSWQELLDASEEWTLQIVARSVLPNAYGRPSQPSRYELKHEVYSALVSSGKAENLAEAQFALNLMELWVLANFMDLYDAVLCSPIGTTLRCPPLIKAHGDAFDWWSWPLSGEKFSQGEAHGYFEGFRAKMFGISDAVTRFVAVDYATGGIQLKANTLRLLSLSSYGHGMSDEDCRRFIAEQIRPIVGWSICWNAEVFPDTERELFESLGFIDLDWTDIDSNIPKKAKSAGNKNILECVVAAYPDGKGTAIWEEVEAKVGYSRRSISRALRANGSYATWAKRGQTEQK